MQEFFIGVGGGPNFGSERTVELFCGKLLFPTPLSLVTEKAETTTCSSICENKLPLAREIHRLLRVPKDNHIFEYSWNVVWWQNTTRVSLKNPGGGGSGPPGYTTSLVPFDILSTAFSNSNTPIANYRCTF